MAMIESLHVLMEINDKGVWVLRCSAVTIETYWSTNILYLMFLILVAVKAVYKKYT